MTDFSSGSNFGGGVGGGGGGGGGGGAAAAAAGGTGPTVEPNSAFADALQRAKQIAAKITPVVQAAVPANSADGNNSLIPGGIKRPLDEGPGRDWGVGPPENNASKKMAAINDPIGAQLAAMQQQHRMGGMQTEKFQVPDKMVGLIIGRGGEQITRLQAESGCKIQMAGDSGGQPTRTCLLAGSQMAIDKAKELITEIVERGNTNVPARGSSITNSFDQSPGPTIEIPIPAAKVGLIIGKDGETIKNLQERSGVKMVLVQAGPYASSSEKPLKIKGDPQKAEYARQLVMELLTDSDLSNQGNQNFNRNNQSHDDNEFDNSENETKEMTVPRPAVGVVIGKGGDMIKKIQKVFGTRIQFKRVEEGEGDGDRVCLLSGTPEQIQNAEGLIIDLINGVIHRDHVGSSRARARLENFNEFQGGGGNDGGYGGGGMGGGPGGGMGGGPGGGMGGGPGGGMGCGPGGRMGGGPGGGMGGGPGGGMGGGPGGGMGGGPGVGMGGGGDFHHGNRGGGMGGGPNNGDYVEFNYSVPPNKCGFIIGKKGETIRSINVQSGARIELSRDMETSTGEKVFIIRGMSNQVEHAKQLISDKLGGYVPLNNSGGGNNYGMPPGNQNGHQPPPPPPQNYNQPPQMQHQQQPQQQQQMPPQMQQQQQQQPQPPPLQQQQQQQQPPLQQQPQQQQQMPQQMPGMQQGYPPAQSWGNPYQPWPTPMQPAVDATYPDPAKQVADAWAAYYAQCYQVQQQQQMAQQPVAAMPPVASAVAASPVPQSSTAPTAVPQQAPAMVAMTPAAAAVTTTPMASTLPDYSVAWVEYYRSVGMYREAEMIQQQSRLGQPQQLAATGAASVQPGQSLPPAAAPIQPQQQAQQPQAQPPAAAMQPVIQQPQPPYAQYGQQPVLYAPAMPQYSNPMAPAVMQQQQAPQGAPQPPVGAYPMYNYGAAYGQIPPQQQPQQAQQQQQQQPPQQQQQGPTQQPQQQQQQPTQQ